MTGQTACSCVKFKSSQCELFIVWKAHDSYSYICRGTAKWGLFMKISKALRQFHKFDISRINLDLRIVFNYLNIYLFTYFLTKLITINMVTNELRMWKFLKLFKKINNTYLSKWIFCFSKLFDNFYVTWQLYILKIKIS